MTQHPWTPGGESLTPPSGDPENDEQIRVRDRRKVDPETYEARPQPEQPEQPAPQPEESASAPAAPTDSQEPVADAAPGASDQRVEELTLDLQRLSAEFANYRKRVDRDRELNRDRAIADVVADLLPVLDDIDRARSHGELDAGFKAVAEAIESMAANYGLVRFGAEGEEFDPHVHEAMTSANSAEVVEPTVTAVYQVGYRLKDQVLRAARVAVTNPE